ncbi:hypothetical protein [Halobacterium jilantaiense]|uniref:Uncharacterized protein n=1 Tax=Halobacterium jilantaiense TaxID=355548 RepID=A0A1I0MTQ7_9EURY|nr:hypothetical protein [Halobacterium jilantaiense]SEV92096.1 hypothetical protein SAMN04487945_0365 [Halobacterium jilantaiense]
MNKQIEVELGILLVLFGGFILVSSSSLPMDFEFGIMLIGLAVGVVGALRPGE